MHVLFLPEERIILGRGTKNEMHAINNGMVHVICGPGKGKSASAVGSGILGALAEKKVILVQFLKGMLEEEDAELLKRLEPEMKVFRFARFHGMFEDLSEEQKSEEMINLKNGFNFAKKVMVTGECDILILDEILGLLDWNVITEDDFIHFLENKDSALEVIITGRVCPERIKPYVDHISHVENIK